MTSSTNHFDLNLDRRAMFNLPDAAGVDIVCRDGTVWVTLDNDYRDYVLEAGDSLHNKEHTRALIYAMQPSRIAVTAANIDRPIRHSATQSQRQGLVLEQVLA